MQGTGTSLVETAPVPRRNLLRRSVRAPHATVPKSATRSFLDFPVEIRLQIYRYFSHIPPEIVPQQDSGDVEDDRHKTLMARYYLQLVCRDISQEWSPIFYSTTTVVASKLERETPEECRDGARLLKATGDDFQSTFINSLPTYNLHSVQRIYYNMTHRIMDQPGVIINYPRAKNFASVLARCLPSLQPLGEIVLACQGDSYDVGHFVEGRLWEYAWRRMVTSKNWKSLQYLLQAGLGSTSSREWCCMRKFHLVEWGIEESFPQDTLRAAIDEWQLVFCKGSGAVATPDGESDSSVPVIGPRGKWVVLPGYTD